MKGYTEHHKQQLSKAVSYLRERKIYILEHDFVPTNAAKTDVAQTITRYRAQIQGHQVVREVRKFK